MLKHIDVVQIPNLWLNRVTGGLSVKKDIVSLDDRPYCFFQ